MWYVFGVYVGVVCMCGVCVCVCMYVCVCIHGVCGIHVQQVCIWHGCVPLC